MMVALANLKQHAFRVLLLTFVAFITFLMFGTLAGSLQAINPSDGVGESDELVVHNNVSFMTGLPRQYGSRIKSTQGVASSVPILMMASYLVEKDDPVPVDLTEVGDYLDFYSEEIIVEDDVRQKLLETRDGVIIDRATANRKNWKVGDRFTLTSALIRQRDGNNEWPFRLVGIYDEVGVGGGGAIGHLDYVGSNVLGFENRVHWFAVKAFSPDGGEQVSAEIDSMFANSPYETLTEPASAMARAFLSQIGDIASIVKAIVGASLVTMLLVIGNSISLSVQRRTKEIGVLRTLGFGKARIFGIVLSETAFIIFLAFMTGMTLSALIVSALFQEFTGVDFGTLYLPTNVWLGGLIIACIMVLLTGGLPSYRAMQMDPTQAFRRD